MMKKPFNHNTRYFVRCAGGFVSHTVRSAGLLSLSASKPASYPSRQALSANQPASYPSRQALSANQPASYPSRQALSANQPASYPSQSAPHTSRQAHYPSQPTSYSNRPATNPTRPLSPVASIVMLLGVLMLLPACGNLSPFQPDPHLRTTETPVYSELNNLPQPQEKLVAAVYRFRDQTGQYKPSDRVASWSTAVTQGSTSILLKAIDDSGWFNPIEREGLSNLMNERQIIRSIRSEHGEDGPLPPMLYAGVMLEGGIIGYDSNTLTGGMGARYLGIGGSTEFRQDKVTIYLRAVSTSSSRIMKTVHSTETILSQKVDAHVFRFVDENKILEGEAGYTVNEPSTVAVTRAIEKAVEKLVMEGIRDGLWRVADEEQEQLDDYFAAYDSLQERRTSIDIMGREMADRRGRIGLGINLEGQRYYGNYPDPLARPSGTVDAIYSITPHVYAGLSAHHGDIAAKHGFEKTYTGTRLNVKGLFFPELSLTPFFEIGGGAMVLKEKPFRYTWNEWFPYVGGAAGLEYMIADRVGLNLSVRHRYALKDGLDGVKLGSYNDHIWSVGGGFVFYGW